MIRVALWLVAISVLVAPTVGWSEPEVRLVASEPTVLTHPPINKSAGNPVYCLVFAGDGAWLATGAASGVFLWDATRGEVRRTLAVDDRGVDSVALDPRGAFLIAGEALAHAATVLQGSGLRGRAGTVLGASVIAALVLAELAPTLASALASP